MRRTTVAKQAPRYALAEAIATIIVIPAPAAVNYAFLPAYALSLALPPPFTIPNPQF